MKTALYTAYCILFGEPKTDLTDSEMARAVLQNWNVPLLGEILAQEVILEIATEVHFTSFEETTRTVGMAEDFATELFGEQVGDEPHFADLARMAYVKRVSTM